MIEKHESIGNDANSGEVVQNMGQNLIEDYFEFLQGNTSNNDNIHANNDLNEIASPFSIKQVMELPSTQVKSIDNIKVDEFIDDPNDSYCCCSIF
jgi:hypothetical protein